MREISRDIGASKRPGPGDRTSLLVDIEVVEKPSFTLCKIRDLFRDTTGLDFFLFFQSEPLGRWKEEPFADRIQLPRYCQLVRSNPMGLARCLSSHQAMTRRAVECNRPVCQRCHAGLTTLHFPVSVAGRGHGDIQTVCALNRSSRADLGADLTARISDLEIPEKEIYRAAEELRILSRSKANKIIEWLELVANYLAEASNRSISNPNDAESPAEPFPAGYPSLEHRIRVYVGRSVPLPTWRAQRSTGGTAALVERVSSFVDQYYYLPLSTQVVSEALGFDPSYFSKVFKQYEHESLTQRLKRARLTRAQKLLRDPYLSVLEVARRTGFNDASYFSRVFRSALGMTPSQFRTLCGITAGPDDA